MSDKSVVEIMDEAVAESVREFRLALEMLREDALGLSRKMEDTAARAQKWLDGGAAYVNANGEVGQYGRDVDRLAAVVEERRNQMRYMTYLRDSVAKAGA